MRLNKKESTAKTYNIIIKYCYIMIKQNTGKKLNIKQDTTNLHGLTTLVRRIYPYLYEETMAVVFEYLVYLPFRQSLEQLKT